MYLYWFRPYREGDGIKRLLDTKSDELKPVFFDGMTENGDSSLQLDPDQHSVVDPSVADPNPDPRVFRPLGSRSGSISQRYGSGF